MNSPATLRARSSATSWADYSTGVDRVVLKTFGTADVGTGSGWPATDVSALGSSPVSRYFVPIAFAAGLTADRELAKTQCLPESRSVTRTEVGSAACSFSAPSYGVAGSPT